MKRKEQPLRIEVLRRQHWKKIKKHKQYLEQRIADRKRAIKELQNKLQTNTQKSRVLTKEHYLNYKVYV